MPKKLIKRLMPDHETVRDHKHLRVFGTLLHDPNLFHLNRRSASGAFAVGLFFAWVPVPFQMVLAAAAAIPLRVNLPLSVALVWLSNPLTMPPFFYFAYLLGKWILNTPYVEFEFQLSFGWLANELGLIWQPFLLGCLIMGIVSSSLGYITIRGLWRLHLVSHLKERKSRSAERKARRESSAE